MSQYPDTLPPKQKPLKTTGRKKTFSTIFSPSVRLTLTYIVLFVWIGLAIFAILMKADLYALAVYFTSGLPVILGYLWAQSARPSLGEAADLVGSIGKSRGQNQNGYGNYGGGGYGGYDGYGGQGYQGNNGNNGNYNQNTQNQNTQTQESQNNIQITIYSDDASAQLKVDQSQLNTLKNVGYVDEVGDKYTFKRGSMDQIKTLIDGNTPDPDI